MRKIAFALVCVACSSDPGAEVPWGPTGGGWSEQIGGGPSAEAGSPSAAGGGVNSGGSTPALGGAQSGGVAPIGEAVTVGGTAPQTGGSAPLGGSQAVGGGAGTGGYVPSTGGTSGGTPPGPCTRYCVSITRYAVAGSQPERYDAAQAFNPCIDPGPHDSCTRAEYSATWFSCRTDEMPPDGEDCLPTASTGGTGGTG